MDASCKLQGCELHRRRGGGERRAKKERDLFTNTFAYNTLTYQEGHYGTTFSIKAPSGDGYVTTLQTRVLSIRFKF